jgi:hypothetical protein
MQSLFFSRVVIKGTPKYLTGREPNLKPRDPREMLSNHPYLIRKHDSSLV